MNRRTLLGAMAGAGVAVLPGCTGFRLQPANRAPPLVEDRPSAVYFPTHIEGMAVIDTVESGDFGIGLTYSYPHRFWTTTGAQTEPVTIRAEDSIHLMATVWGVESGMVLPIGAGLTIRVDRDGETILEQAPWPMISPTMGFHFGDNIALRSEGTYTITVRVGPVTDRRLGGFAGRFDEGTEATVAFEFSRRRRDELAYRTFDDRAGTPDAPDLMTMERLPTSRLPAVEELPGNHVGRGTTGDAEFLVRRLDTADGPYLAVSPRTPYNRIPLPLMSLALTVEGGGSVRFDGPLKSAIHPELGYHYGRTLDALATGDRLTVSVQAPPQVSRHEGYETAFLDMPPLTMAAN